MDWRRSATGVVGLGLCLAANCAELTPLEQGTCGNGIVEPDNHEDCDTFPTESCIAPGQTGACRYKCDPEKAGADCPKGAVWGCGSSGICSKASSAFAAGVHPTSTHLTRVYEGNFDGDKYPDVLGLSLSDIHIFYSDPAKPFAETAVISRTFAPVAGVLAGTTATDLVLLAQGGISILQGTGERSFTPTIHSSIDIETPLTHFVALDAMPGDWKNRSQYFGDEIVVFANNFVVVPGASEESGVEVLLFQMTEPASKLLGEVQVANFWEDPAVSACQEMALAYQGGTQVLVLTPCVRVGEEYTWNNNSGKLLPVTLGTTITSGPLAADLNGDKHIDLVVLDSGFSLYAAFGTGEGTFHSDPSAVNNPQTTPDQKFRKMTLSSSTPVALKAMPLAIAEITGDECPEFVLGAPTSAIYRSQPGCKADGDWTLDRTVWKEEGVWTGATIADLNGNGLPDVLAWSSERSNFDFYNGVGNGVFNTFEIPTQGMPGEARIGDFDGDLLGDVVFSDRTSGAADTLAVLFGRPFGMPEAPTTIGPISSIERILPMNMAMFRNLDAATDLIVVSSEDNRQSLGIFAGSGDRQLRSRLFLTRTVDESTQIEAVPSRLLLGRFAGDAHLDLATLATDSAAAAMSNRDASPRLYLIPVTGTASIAPSNITWSEPFPPQIRVSEGLIAAVDLDRDDVDEVVILANSGDLVSSQGTLVLARSKKTGEEKHQFEIAGEPQPTTALWLQADNRIRDPGAPDSPDQPTIPEEIVGNLGGQIRVIDVDGDGLKDVAATGILVANGNRTRALFVYRNKGDGTLSATDAQQISSPSTQQQLQGFAFLQADTDLPLEVVLLTRDAAYLADIDVVNKTVSTPVKLKEAQTNIDVRGGLDALAGDYNRDGVQDIVIVSERGLSFYAGIETHR